MKVKVMFFGVLTEAAGTNSEEFEGVNNLVDLKEAVESRFPKVAEYSYKAAVNEQLTSANTELSDNDEIALLPPYAGG